MAHPVTITRAQPRDTPRLQPTQLALSMCVCVYVCVFTNPRLPVPRTPLSLSLHPPFLRSLSSLCECTYDHHPLPSGACDRYYARACPLPRYRSHLVIILDCTERSLGRYAAPDRLYLANFLAPLQPRFPTDYVDGFPFPLPSSFTLPSRRSASLPLRIVAPRFL